MSAAEKSARFDASLLPSPNLLFIPNRLRHGGHVIIVKVFTSRIFLKKIQIDTFMRTISMYFAFTKLETIDSCRTQIYDTLPGTMSFLYMTPLPGKCHFYI